MRPIPKPLLKKILDDPYYAICCHGGCSKQAELEHAIKVSGRQLNEYWAIIPCCPGHNRGKELDKRKNEWYALRRASDADLAKYPKCTEQWKRDLNYYSSLYDKGTN